MSIGRFENRSSYNNGVFSDGQDRLGNQSQTILTTFLQQAGCYQILDRTNMTVLAQESKLSGTKQSIKGAKYVINSKFLKSS